MKDIYSALEYKLAQAKKKRINVNSSVTLDSIDQNDQSLERLKKSLQDDMSLTELQRQMFLKMKTKSPTNLEG